MVIFSLYIYDFELCGCKIKFIDVYIEINSFKINSSTPWIISDKMLYVLSFEVQFHKPMKFKIFTKFDVTKSRFIFAYSNITFGSQKKPKIWTLFKMINHDLHFIALYMKGFVNYKYTFSFYKPLVVFGE